MRQFSKWLFVATAPEINYRLMRGQKMILISLDIDGVLYYTDADRYKKHLEEIKKEHGLKPSDQASHEMVNLAAVDLFDKSALHNLHLLISLIEKTGEKVGILLHSNWRINLSADYLKNVLFKQHAFAEKIIDKIADNGVLSNLIAKWLTQYSKQYNIKDYIIIDDHNWDAFPLDHLILCKTYSLFNTEKLKETVLLLKRTINIEWSEEKLKIPEVPKAVPSINPLKESKLIASPFLDLNVKSASFEGKHSVINQIEEKEPINRNALMEELTKCTTVFLVRILVERKSKAERNELADIFLMDKEKFHYLVENEFTLKSLMEIFPGNQDRFIKNILTDERVLENVTLPSLLALFPSNDIVSRIKAEPQSRSYRIH
jgi:hypothetical protein